MIHKSGLLKRRPLLQIAPYLRDLVYSNMNSMVLIGGQNRDHLFTVVLNLASESKFCSFKYYMLENIDYYNAPYLSTICVCSWTASRVVRCGKCVCVYF